MCLQHFAEFGGAVWQRYMSRTVISLLRARQWRQRIRSLRRTHAVNTTWTLRHRRVDWKCRTREWRPFASIRPYAVRNTAISSKRNIYLYLFHQIMVAVAWNTANIIYSKTSRHVTNVLYSSEVVSIFIWQTEELLFRPALYITQHTLRWCLHKVRHGTSKHISLHGKHSNVSALFYIDWLERNTYFEINSPFAPSVSRSAFSGPAFSAPLIDDWTTSFDHRSCPSIHPSIRPSVCRSFLSLSAASVSAADMTRRRPAARGHWDAPRRPLTASALH